MRKTSLHFRISLAVIGVVFALVICFLELSSEPSLYNKSASSSVSYSNLQDADALKGHGLPFSIILAIRNFGFPRDMLPAMIAVSVDGGVPADWMATGIYVAEHSIINGVVAAKVEVYVSNPWGDMPPTRNKQLADVTYAPDPKHSPWGGGNVWLIMPAAKAGTMAEIEFDKLVADFTSNKTVDPKERLAVADEKARSLTIKKYELSPNWRASEGLGLTGGIYQREKISVLEGPDINGSLTALNACLNSNGGSDIFRGCYPFQLRSQTQ